MQSSLLRFLRLVPLNIRQNDARMRHREVHDGEPGDLAQIRDSQIHAPQIGSQTGWCPTSLTSAGADPRAGSDPAPRTPCEIQLLQRAQACPPCIHRDATGCWSNPHRSLIKACLLVQKGAPCVLLTMDGPLTQQDLFHMICHSMKGCIMNTRKKHPNPSQRVFVASG